MRLGSEVYITGGTHKGLEGKIVAISDLKSDLK
jgi:ribosomal protein L24